MPFTIMRAESFFHNFHKYPEQLSDGADVKLEWGKCTGRLLGGELEGWYQKKIKRMRDRLAGQE